MRIAWIAAVGIVSLAVTRAENGLVVHEWGTFTFVADQRGLPVQWAPLSGVEDLPCFVSRLDLRNYKTFPGLVRMETPVLFFYSQHPMTASVHVDFPKGWITEYYPVPSNVSKESGNNSYTGMGYRNGRADWNSIEVLAGENPPLPSSKGPSRYYEARNTDAAAVRLGKQNERMIFYRGIGSFIPPVQPKFMPNGKLHLRTTIPDTIPLAIVFENRGGNIGYRFVRSLSKAVDVDPPEIMGDLRQLRKELVAELVEFGLYQKEALAMVETWHDSWFFEEGMRVFYVVPRAQTDALLPLNVTPAPQAIARVFVGRVEVLSPWARQTVQTAADQRDLATLKKFGRFLEPFAAQMKVQTSFMREAQAEIAKTANGSACVQ